VPEPVGVYAFGVLRKRSYRRVRKSKHHPADIRILGSVKKTPETTAITFVRAQKQIPSHHTVQGGRGA